MKRWKTLCEVLNGNYLRESLGVKRDRDSKILGSGEHLPQLYH